MDRRTLLKAGLGALAGGVLLPRRSEAQAIGIVRLSDRMTLVTSGGTNVLVFSSPDGLVLVDSGAPESSDALMQALGRIANGARIATVFNTHYHLDHTGANGRLRAAGAEIVAHVNTRLWMSTPVWVPADDRYRAPRPADALPTKTFYTTESMTAGGEHIECGHLIEAHTSGDIYVFFRDANVLAAGDVASPLRDPALDWLTGAWLGGRVDAMTRLVAMSDDRTQIVPGTGPVMTRAQLAAERDVLKTIYDRAVDRIRQGDDAGDMLEAGVLKDLPRTWSEPRTFLYDVQKGLWAHHNKLHPNVV